MSPYEISKKGRDFSVVISGVARVKQVGGGGGPKGVPVGRRH